MKNRTVQSSDNARVKLYWSKFGGDATTPKDVYWSDALMENCNGDDVIVGDLIPRVESDYPVNNVRVMNTSGMLLMEIKDDYEQIPIENLQTGLYLVEVEIERHKVVKKLVKQ